MVKYSRQREAILMNLQSRRDHPTADMVYEAVREQQPNISLGTVYRNLSFLAENGQILKLSTRIGPDHFDGFIHPHNHFICKSCGQIVDLAFEADEDFVKKASTSFDGSIEGYELQFFGKCKQCIEKNN